MNSKTKSKKGKSAALDSLATAKETEARLVEDLVNEELEKVLYERKLKKIRFKGAIFSHLKKGVVVTGPVSVPSNLTRTDLGKASHPVGFLVNTVQLVDPVSRRTLEPGVTLVEMRPLMGGDFAFDFIGGDGKVKMATDTQRPHHPGHGSDLSDPGGPRPPAKQHFDIEVNHVIKYPHPDDLLPDAVLCTSYSDGTEKCFYVGDDENDFGFTTLG